jgi:hypothetical protein
MRWRRAGLFTFSQSAKHVGLHGKFGFCPCFLTAIMVGPAARSDGRDLSERCSQGGTDYRGQDVVTNALSVRK